MGNVRATSFELPLPPGWADRTAVTVAGPRAQDGYVPNLVVTQETLCDGLGLHGFAEGHANLLRLHASEFAVLSREDCELAGERAALRIVRWRMGDEPALVQLQAFVVHDGVGYAIVGTATEDAFSGAEPHLRAMVDGFRFCPMPAVVGAQ